MAANAMQWPAAIFPRQAMFHPDTPSRSGGLSITGFEQVTVSNAGRWKARVDVPITNENAILAWRAMLAQLEGRTGTILVPKWELQGPRDINGRRLEQIGSASYAEDLYNWDLSGWGQDEFTHARLASAAALGATQISLTLVNGRGPQPGQYFGIGNRLYLAHAVWQETPTSPTQVRFWPRLRAAASSSTRVILDRPVCLMRLADDTSGELSLEFGRWGNASLDFIEAV